MSARYAFLKLIFCVSTSAAAQVPDASVDGIARVKSWSAARVQAAQQEFQKSGGRHQPSPGFWGEQTVYLIQADRFNDGDPSNNKINIEPAQAKGDLRAIFDFHHGG